MTFIPCSTICYPVPKPNDSDGAAIPNHRSNYYRPANGPAQLAVNRSLTRKRDVGQFVTVLLMDDGEPSTEVKNLVMKYAKLWEDYCSIRFKFVDDPKADIRVSFVVNGGHWSYLGTNRAGVHPTECTMNLELNDDTEKLRYAKSRSTCLAMRWAAYTSIRVRLPRSSGTTRLFLSIMRIDTHRGAERWSNIIFSTPWSDISITNGLILNLS